jgi:uncharacterized protein
MNESNKRIHKKLHREMIDSDMENIAEIFEKDEVAEDLKIDRVYKDNILEKAMIKKAEEFLVSHRKHKNYIEETIHPWRKDAEQIIMHSFRVYSYALKIIASNKDKLASEEIMLIKLAAILHDTGKFYKKENHAQKSVEIVQKWLNENNKYYNNALDENRLLRMIGGHSNKGDEEDHDLCSLILKDADILDEIGAISIFMSSNWLDKTSPYFFHELSNRLQMQEIDFCDNNYSKLKTTRAKEIMNDKKAFIENFIVQLNSELEGTEEFYEIMKDN